MINAPDDEHGLQSMLKIHLELCELQRYKNPKLKYKMDGFEWDPMFDRAIVKWFVYFWVDKLKIFYSF